VATVLAGQPAVCNAIGATMKSSLSLPIPGSRTAAAFGAFLELFRARTAPARSRPSTRVADTPRRPALRSGAGAPQRDVAPPFADVDPPLLPARDLLASIAREAEIAERTEAHHSVLVVDVGRHRRDPGAVRRTLRAALAIAMGGDDVGWLDFDHLALSLPMTDAAAVARRATALQPLLLPADCTVYSQSPRGALPDTVGAAGIATRPLAALLRDPLPRWKRAVDVVGAALLLVLSAPLLLVAALLVRCTSRGPVLHRQRRAGLHGVPFVICKFRTMVVGAEAMKAQLLRFNERSGPVFKMKNDPRVTRVGRFLRATSIDELPQLWNVLRGEMSLVGPRPPTLDEVQQYRSWQLRRLSVRPGITCTWQVASRGGIDFDNWVRMDLRYIAQRSFACDLRLLTATVPAVVCRRGAC